MTDQNACLIPFHSATPVVTASQTVLIGGLFAARVTDKVACGAAISQGKDNVFIGGPTINFPDIRIGGDDAYKASVQMALARILTAPDGLLWVQQYAATGRTMQIVPYPAADNAWTHYQLGGDSLIEWDPGYRYYGHQSDGAGNLTGYVESAPEETLFHEMIHGLHHAQGNRGVGTTPVPSEPNQATEEAQTIGNGPFAGTHPTENGWRQQAGMTGQRSDHWGTSLGNNAPGVPIHSAISPSIVGC